MFYTVVAGWMLYYFYSFLTGKFSGLKGDAVTGKFNEMLSSPSILVITMLLITIAGFLICSVGLYNARRKRGSEILSGAGQAAD